MASTPAVSLCGGLEPLRQQPCPRGGPDHAPFPNGYGADYEYAAQLLTTGWTQHRCQHCGLWGIWIPEQPQPQPPMRPHPNGDAWEIPDDLTGYEECDDALEEDEHQIGTGMLLGQDTADDQRPETRR